MKIPFLAFRVITSFASFAVVQALADANDWTERPYHAFGLADRGHDLRAEKEKDGVREIRTTGSDPYLSTVGLTERIDPFTPYRVMFQYRSSTDLKNFQVLYQTPGGLRHLNQEMPASKDWRWHAFELSKGDGGLRERVEWLRFDFGEQTGRKFLIRDMRLIKAKPEFDLTALDHLPFSLKEKGHQATVETLAGGGWSISTLGKDPFVMTTGFAEAHQPETPYVLATPRSLLPYRIRGSKSNSRHFACEWMEVAPARLLARWPGIG
jgi:hypothetical protein